MNIKTAMIFAAGMGTRIAEAIDYPKTMITVDGQSLIERLLNEFYEYGIETIFINTHFKADYLEQHIMSLPVYRNLRINFIRETKLLESAGTTKNLLPLVKENYFFIANADILLLNKHDYSYLSMLDSKWKPLYMQQLLMVIDKKRAWGYNYEGDFNLNEQEQLLKDNHDKQFVYTGIGITHKNYFINTPNDRFTYYDIWRNHLQENGVIKHAYGMVFNGYWMHIGDPKSFQCVEQYYQNLKKKLLKVE